MLRQRFEPMYDDDQGSPDDWIILIKASLAVGRREHHQPSSEASKSKRCLK